MLWGPIFGSLLFALGGFRLPFYVTGAGLYTIMICAFFILPSNEAKVQTEYYSPNSGILKENKLSYFECFKSLVSSF